MAVFEVGKPAHQRAIQVDDDDREAVPVGASRLLTHRVFELLQALLPRQPIARLEVVAEEVKAAGLLHVHELGFLGMQLQAAASVQRCTIASACSASSAVRHRMTKSSA